jgi:hypothetical protein
MRSRSNALFALAALASFAALGPAQAKEDSEYLYGKLQSYRAVYDLRQIARSANAAPVTVSGRMTTETRIGCKEIEVAASLTLRVASGGRSVDVDSEWKTQETSDGRTFRHSMHMMQGGRVVRRHEAEAVLQTREGPGRGIVKRGAPETLKLEPGTVLPGTHSLRALAAAAAGRTEVKHRVYVGEDEVRLADLMTTVVGSGTAPANAALGEAAGKAGWRLRDVSRAVGPGQNGAPRLTESFITNDGITTSTTFTVQGIRLASTASKIELLPKAKCP